jgi:hypothetical protein
MSAPQNQTNVIVPLPLLDDDIRLAIKNVAEFGDTDVFPFPLENAWFYDKPDTVLEQVQTIRGWGNEAYAKLQVFYTTELTNTGFLGFRPATQIDPLWNVCFLAAVLRLAPSIEVARLPADRVFSYRFDPDHSTGALFSNVGWREFHLKGLELAKQYAHLAIVDISDFYPRIYHHRLENALANDCGCDGEVVKFVDEFLRKVNPGISFGLPVGGPASRILAEAVLNRTDHHLRTRKIECIRFVDDYIIFGKTEDHVRTSVLELNRLLLDNEGLTLNRNKTRLLTSEEYRNHSVFAEANESKSVEEQEKRKFFAIHLRYDPYSPTADADYEALAASIREYDVLGMLERELHKSRIDKFAVGQLIKALRFMDKPQRSDAIKTLAENLQSLSPIFSVVATAFRKIQSEIYEDSRDLFFRRVRELLQNRSPLIGATGTLAFAIRVLADDSSQDAEVVLDTIYKQSDRTPLTEREIVLAMARRRTRYWLSDLKNRFSSVTNPWARRALLAGSFVLGDEGKNWRKSIRRHLNPCDTAFLDWVSEKNNGKQWEFPL